MFPACSVLKATVTSVTFLRVLANNTFEKPVYIHSTSMGDNYPQTKRKNWSVTVLVKEKEKGDLSLSRGGSAA